MSGLNASRTGPARPVRTPTQTGSRGRSESIVRGATPSPVTRLLLAASLSIDALACSSGPSARMIYSNRLDHLESIVTQTGVSLDTSRGGGGLRIDVNGTSTIRLVELRPHVDDAVALVYRGHLRSTDLQGRAYLAISCSTSAGQVVSAKGLDSAVTGSTEWTLQALRLSLDQPCETARLNVAVEGRGTVGVRNIALARVTR